MRQRSLLVLSLFLTITAVWTQTGCAISPSRVGNGLAPQSTETKSDQIDRLFDVLDVNSDGRISKVEAQAGFKYLIASYDRDGKNEILAAKPGGGSSSTKSKSKRRPTSHDANRAFEALFVKDGSATETLSKDEFKKLVVKASDNPETDPFATFYE